MTETSTIDRAELKRLCAEATPGPWTSLEVKTASGRAFRIGAGEMVAEGGGKGSCIIYDDYPIWHQNQRSANAGFIAAANPAVVSALLAELEAMEASALAWKLIAKGNSQLANLSPNETCAALEKALETQIDETEQLRAAKDAEIERLKARVEDELADNVSLNNEKMDLKYNQLAAANALIAKLAEALKPFADEAETWADTVPDDHRSLCTEPGYEQAFPGSETKFTVGDLRRARSALSEAPGGEKCSYLLSPEDNGGCARESGNIGPCLCVSGPSTGAQDVLIERRRQMESEGWTPAHDDEHSSGELAAAAACYAMVHVSKAFRLASTLMEHMWPWDPLWWKPTTTRRNLVKAGALIIAEIERLDRSPPRPQSTTRNRGMACEHDILERECAVHDGACSLCAEAEIAQLKEFAAWVETWVSNPVGSYSVSALDGLFGLARDRLAKIAPAITEGK